jgi:RNA polymerase sigma-70 factor (ECF subfamily)
MEGATALERAAAERDLEGRFTTFVRSHRDRARSLAWRLVGGDEAAAEDVTQEALVKAYEALGRFREDSSLATWFYRILVRQAAKYRRWRAVREAWSGIWQEEHPDPAPREAGDPALRRRIARALDGLTRSQREAFVLVHMEGFTVRECADLLGKPPGTVKSHLHRALAALRSELTDLAAPGREGGLET